MPLTIEIKGVFACYNHAKELVWWFTHSPWERKEVV